MKTFQLPYHEDLHVRCGINGEDYKRTMISLVNGLTAEMISDIEDEYGKQDDESFYELLKVEGFGITIGIADLAQQAAELLDRELTAEIGLVIGMLIERIVSDKEQLFNLIYNELKFRKEDEE